MSVLKRRHCAREKFYLSCTEIRSHGRPSLGGVEGGGPCGRATRRACTTVGGAEERGHREERCQSGALCVDWMLQVPSATPAGSGRESVAAAAMFSLWSTTRVSYWTDKTPSQCLSSPSCSKNDQDRPCASFSTVPVGSGSRCLNWSLAQSPPRAPDAYAASDGCLDPTDTDRASRLLCGVHCPQALPLASE